MDVRLTSAILRMYVLHNLDAELVNADLFSMAGSNSYVTKAPVLMYLPFKIMSFYQSLEFPT